MPYDCSKLQKTDMLLVRCVIALCYSHFNDNFYIRLKLLFGVTDFLSFLFCEYFSFYKTNYIFICNICSVFNSLKEWKGMD